MRPLSRVPWVLLLAGGAAVASAFVLVAGGLRPDAGLALWMLRAAAAIGVLALLARPNTSTG